MIRDKIPFLNNTPQPEDKDIEILPVGECCQCGRLGNAHGRKIGDGFLCAHCMEEGEEKERALTSTIISLNDLPEFKLTLEGNTYIICSPRLETRKFSTFDDPITDAIEIIREETQSDLRFTITYEDTLVIVDEEITRIPDDEYPSILNHGKEYENVAESITPIFDPAPDKSEVEILESDIKEVRRHSSFEAEDRIVPMFLPEKCPECGVPPGTNFHVHAIQYKGEPTPVIEHTYAPTPSQLCNEFVGIPNKSRIDWSKFGIDVEPTGDLDEFSQETSDVIKDVQNTLEKM